MPKLNLAAIGVLSLAAIVACKKDAWQGFVYPDKSNLLDYRELGEFATLEDCRASANLYLRDLNATDRGDYECGRNCKRQKDLTVKVCAETAR